jgi:uncharacterized protein YdhG (YjbR/CyaY superfamily)
MVRSAATDVASHIADAPQERRAALTALRAACLEELEGYEERMAYGMPSYVRGEVAEVAFASQRQYVSVYVARSDVMEANAERLAAVDRGKGRLRFRGPEAIDLDLIRSLLRQTRASAGPVC